MEEKIGRKVTRETVTQGILVGCFLFGAVSGAAIGVMKIKNIDVSSDAVSMIFYAFMAVLVAVSVVYWRFLDEAAREAHKFAWLWGGIGGGLLSFPVLELMPAGYLEGAFGPEKNTTWFGLGMFFMLAMQAIGYGVAWVGWWLARWR